MDVILLIAGGLIRVYSLCMLETYILIKKIMIALQNNINYTLNTCKYYNLGKMTF